MKTNRINSQRSAFTLIEMVGVLAVIAILAALLVPKIFAAINDSRFSNSVASLNSVKTASMDYFGKKGNFPTVTTNFVGDLINENCLERPLACKIATGAYVQIVEGSGCNGGVGFKLDGTAVTTSTTTNNGLKVVQCVLEGVQLSDARELSRRMDGDTAVLTPTTGADAAGRVSFADADPTTVYVYVAHK